LEIYSENFARGNYSQAPKLLALGIFNNIKAYSQIISREGKWKEMREWQNF
jgi:hypothetical protein